MTRVVDLGVLLGLAYQALVDELRASLHERGFTDLGPAYGYVFRELADEALQLTQIAERLGMSDQSAAKIINEMEERGYVEWQPDPSDGRARLLSLTARGLAALAAARRFHATYEQRLRRSFGDEELVAVRRVLSAAVHGEDGDLAQAHLRVL